MSVLDPATIAILRKCDRPTPKLLKDADIWHAAHTVGPIKLYPRTDGKYALADTRRPPMDLFFEVLEDEKRGTARMHEVGHGACVIEALRLLLGWAR